ncbi:unnamed protein product [Heligmosomoides polygyrus]|uniref:Tudor domain-containing protein n=1 Tax=Heligmosomoides polygyrus TaxID=6339 RepID=A0A3P8AEC5_HELPZ|nr:unnamed protein product [Heligmosomoides polygyrus]
MAAPLAVYERNKEMYCHPIIWYHDVIHDTENVLTSVFNELGIPLSRVAEAVECKNVDSQKESFLSRENLKHVKLEPITDSDRELLRDYAKKMDVTRFSEAVADIHITMADEELASYRLQFQQVEAALLGDPDNLELRKLKSDLEEVIALQEELASTSASSSVPETVRVNVPAKKYEIGDRVMAPLPNGNRAVAVVDSLTAAGVAVIFISSGQKTIVDPSDLSNAPDTGKKHYVFDTNRGPSSKTSANKKEWLAERERRRMRAQKKEMKKKELESAKESEKNSWLKFTRIKPKTLVSSRANQFAFKSARGAMDSLF